MMQKTGSASARSTFSTAVFGSSLWTPSAPTPDHQHGREREKRLASALVLWSSITLDVQEPFHRAGQEPCFGMTTL